MSDWVMKDWRTAPRAKYAFAFLGVAVVVSAAVLGASMTAIPAVGGFDDEQVLLVAENRLSAVESLWVEGIYVLEDNNIQDESMPSREPLDRSFPTGDPTVRWIVQSYFMLLAKLKETEKHRAHYDLQFGNLLETVDVKFAWATAEGTFGAWELVFNGTRSHFGSAMVDDLDLIPEGHWTVTHDYSGEVEWGKETGTVPFRAKLIFHLWFETEEPSF